MWEFRQKCLCVKICTDLAHRHVVDEIAITCHCSVYSNSYYTVVASIFLVSAASCKAIYGVASVRTSDYSQPFWLKRHPHALIKYAHMLICISAGEGSQHFSAFHL